MKHYFNYFYCFFIFLFAINVCYGQKGKIAASGKYDYQGSLCNGLAKVKKNNKWGFVDASGNLVVSPKYDEVENFSDGLARVRIKHHGKNGGGWGLVDASGKEVIKPMFDWIYDFENGKAKVKSNGSEGYIDRNGNMVQ